jgi:hypothetical protein
MLATQTASTKTTFEFDGTKCTIIRRESGYMVTVIEGGMEIDVTSADGRDIYSRASDIMTECKKMHAGGVMAPTPTVLAARARGIWACDRVAYVFSLAARKIAQGGA